MFEIDRSLLHQIMKIAQKAAKASENATCFAVMSVPSSLQGFVAAAGSLVHGTADGDSALYGHAIKFDTHGCGEETGDNS